MAGGKYHSLFDLSSDVKYEFILGDIRKEEDLKVALRDVRLVFDLAGITSVPLSFRRERETMEINVEGARKLLETAINSGVERIVYSSSAAVYGSVEGLVDEKTQPNPESPYARSKLLAEQLYMEAWRERGLDIVILRFGTVFGYAPGIRFDTVVNKFTFLAAIGHPLTVWKGTENAYRPYLYVGDAVNALVFAATNNSCKGEVFNVTTENASLSKLIDTIRLYVPDVRVRYVEPPYAKQISYGLKDDKIREAGFKPHGSLRRGVKEVLDVFKSFIVARLNTTSPKKFSV